MAVLTLVTPALAQVERASISGIGTYRSKAGLASASIQAKSIETGVSTSTVANTRGTRNQLVRERVNTQFRVEVFNLLNTPQLGAPDGSVTSPTFGRILSGSGNRVLQLGVRISF